MNSPRLAIVALAALLAAGCRTRPEQRAMFDSYQEEARRLEARIYDLEYDKQVLCDENARLKKRLERVALGKPDKVDEGPRIFPRSTPRAGTSNEPDAMDLTPPEIDLGPATAPEGTNKPVTPESESVPPDVDSPPGESSPEPPADEPPDEPPPRPASILKRPGNVPAAETLPAPRSTTNPKKPELLPAPAEKKVSQLSFQWQADSDGKTSVPPANQQRWMPRSAQRRQPAN